MQQPTLNPTPFAQNGQKNTIPDTASGGTASFSQGFPALTMTPISQGGIPPSGQDFNGILNHLDSHIVWQSAGMGYNYDNNFANAIGGYAVGAVLRSKDGLTAYVNTVAGNRTDPEGGQGWNVYAGAGLKIEPIKVGGILIHTAYNTPEEVRTGEGYGVWTRFADGRVLMGSGTGTDSNGTSMAFTNGQTGGEYNHKLTVDEMPNHSHDFHLSTHITGNGYPATNNQDNNLGDMKTDSTGGDKPHNNIQPFIAVGMWLRMPDNYVAPQL